MGCDIHGVWQKFDATTTTWVDVPSEYDQNRNYQLFAVLADVRNGYGFAGIPTGDKVTPIAEPRGLPTDFVVDEDARHPITDPAHTTPWRRRYIDAGDPPDVWMGDHSYSWLEGAEMLEWVETAPTVTQVGVLSGKEYDAWDKTTMPPSYCGAIGGRGIVMTDDPNDPKPWTHISVSWKSALAGELGSFFGEVARLQREHGRIRFVFGFDS